MCFTTKMLTIGTLNSTIIRITKIFIDMLFSFFKVRVIFGFTYSNKITIFSAKLEPDFDLASSSLL
jgi:hypothetical protein